MSVSGFFLDGIDVDGSGLPRLLPLVHTANSMKGLEFLNNGSLTKPPVCLKCETNPCVPCDIKPPYCERCEVFPKDNPVYLFYGKPAYKPMDETTTGDIATHKMVFILKNYPRTSDNIIRVFPFDSGAFHRGKFGRHISPRLYKFDHFKMSTDINELPKHISFFWGNNKNFMKYENSAPNKGIKGLKFAVRAYTNLITSDSEEEFDDRCAIPEVQSEEIHDLFDYLRAVIVSDEIMNHYFVGELKRRLDDKKIKIIPYYVHKRTLTKDIGDMYKIVRKFYNEIGVL